MRNIRIALQYLSARTCICAVPFPQLLTIHAVSKAARKPRAIPVPKGQKGYTHQKLRYYKVGKCHCINCIKMLKIRNTCMLFFLEGIQQNTAILVFILAIVSSPIHTAHYI